MLTRITKQYNSSANLYRINVYAGATKIEVETGTGGQSVWTVLNNAISDLYEANGYGAAPDYAYEDAAAAITSGSTIAAPTLTQLNAAPDGATATFNGHTWVKTPQTIGATTIRRWIRAGGNVLTNANREHLTNLTFPGQRSRYSPTPDMTTSDGNINYTVNKPGAYLTHNGKPVQSFRFTTTNRQTGVTTTHTYTATGTQNSLGAHNYTDSATNTVSGIPSLPANATNIVYATDIVEVPTNVSIDIPDAPTVTKTDWVYGEWANGGTFAARNFAVGTVLNDGTTTKTLVINNGRKQWRVSNSVFEDTATATARTSINQPERQSGPWEETSWTIVAPAEQIVARGTHPQVGSYPVGTKVTLIDGGARWPEPGGPDYNTLTAEIYQGHKRWVARTADGTYIANRATAINNTSRLRIELPWGAYNTRADGSLILLTHRDPNGAFRGTAEPAADAYHLDRDNAAYRQLIHGTGYTWEEFQRVYSGFSKGLRDRFRAAIAEGFEDGYEDGWVQGYEDGFEVGYGHGYADGFADGREVN